ncbi:ABC transporter ATP-binding protein [Microlunatus sp. GCM10028923]|uniref:ABC transporter ATP-binding protein n=1 Tax=Microlunatus sp. GCM10028923 TaxID=3273400 RepID=UPI0036182723
MATEVEPAAALDQVSKSYPGGVQAVDRVSLEVAKGEFFSLLGPSGCGKTTSLRILAGLEVPTEGRVLIDGTDVTRLPPNRRPTNLIFQKLALFPHLSVAENIAFGPRLQRKSRREVDAKVAEMLELVELRGFEARLPSEISGGQQQRVAIARALANDPAVLLLDEPLGALDLKLRVQMQLALKRIQRNSGTTFIFVTHDQIEAMTMSDRMAVMHNGRVDQVGPPEQLYAKPATTFCASFLGDTNLIGDTAPDRAFRADALRGGHADQLVSIRPERLIISATRPGDGPGVAARVSQLTFQGATVRVVATTDHGRELLVDVPAHAAGDLVPDRPVFVSWPDDAVVTLPK